MNKIICNICGSTYLETAEQCPICGSSREFGVEDFEYIPEKMPEYIPDSKKKTGIFSGAVKLSSDSFYDIEPNEFDLPLGSYPAGGDTVDPSGHVTKHRVNYFAIVLLSLLIGVCIIVSAFLFFRYYLPHTFSWETEPRHSETEHIELEPILPAETSIPCNSIVLTSGVPEITRIGQYWLLHVLVMPEDTTDQLTFTSSDESVVTVTAEGRLCSVGEGTTTVVITCGSEQIMCQVTVKLPQEETETDAQTQQSEQVDTEGLSGSVENNEETQILLKLKQTDISFTKKGVTFQLELDCPLDPKDVAWMTLDPDVAICHDGLVTVLGKGTTRIVAQYGDQQVYCIIRCDFE